MSGAPGAGDLERAWAAVCGDLAGPLVVAFSGGGDSLALLETTLRLARAPVHSVTIDHALRAGSDALAARARDQAQALGAAAHVRPALWAGDPRPSQAHARTARWAALAAAATELGAHAVLFGHTRDDQAETLLMRAGERGAIGLRHVVGLSARRPWPDWPRGRGLLAVRPFLGLNRARLRERLQARDLSWQDDPANADPRFARTRARARLDVCPAERDRLAALADRLEARAGRLDAAAAALIADGAAFEADGAIGLDQAVFAAFPRTVAVRALQALVAAAAGARAPPAPAPVARRLTAWLDRGAGGTLGGARVDLRGRGARLRRDPGAMLGRQGRPGLAPQPLDGATIWDGRFLLRPLRPGLWVAPSGQGADPAGPAWALAPDGPFLPLSAEAAGAVACACLVRERAFGVLWRAEKGCALGFTRD